MERQGVRRDPGVEREASRVNARSLRRLVIDRLIEPAIPRRRLESYLIFWAKLVYRLRKPLIVSITGSVGKSTTTALVAHVLSTPAAMAVTGPVGSTFSNMNDDVGVSATLLRYRDVLELPWEYHRRVAMFFAIAWRALRALALRDYPKVMVLECGAGWTASLARIATIAPPTISVVTRIGAAHLEKLRTIEGVVREKGALVRAVPPSGLVVLGREHAFVSELQRMSRAPVVVVPGHGVELSQNVARAVCNYLHIPADACEAALETFKRPEGRLNTMDLPAGTVIDDTYNANPMSMQLALDTLAQLGGRQRRRIAVLGPMGELGDDASRYHVELGAYARERADLLIGVGAPSREYAADHWFATSEDCVAAIERIVAAGDVVLVKGSASAKMPLIVERLRTVFATRAEALPQARGRAAPALRADFVASGGQRERSGRVRARR